MSTTLIPERLAQLSKLSVDSGSHQAFEQGHCAMELAAWLAGEPHSDSPRCACPIVANTVIRLNDSISDNARRAEVLKPLIPRVIGTRGSDALRDKRYWIRKDWVIRDLLPFVFEWYANGRPDLADLAPIAEQLRALPEIVDSDTYEASAEIRKRASELAWKVREGLWQARRDRFRAAFEAELEKRGVPAAAAAAAADAAAAAAADADALNSIDRYSKVWNAVYNVMRPIWDQRLGDTWTKFAHEIHDRRAALVVRLIETPDPDPHAAPEPVAA